MQEERFSYESLARTLGRVLRACRNRRAPRAGDEIDGMARAARHLQS